jgi:hypothetical protein
MSDAVVLAPRAPWSKVGLVIAVAASVASAGCRTSSWSAPSSWSMFGGQPKTENSLAATAAPPPGDITKPSATAQPYPTTSTPQSYSLTGATDIPGTPAAADVGPVVYGSTPPPSAPAAVAAAGRSPDPAPPDTPLAAIAPQVGPYASSGGGAANAWAAPPPVATPESSPYPALPPGAPSAGSPPARLAENTPATSWSAAAESAVAEAGTSSRYSAGASRFSSPAAAPAGTATDSAAFQPLFGAPAAAPPPPPASTFDQAVPPPAPPAAMPSMLPAAAPQRRPDPGYRPGGTSSYRPQPDVMTGQRTIQPVSFDGNGPPAR